MEHTPQTEIPKGLCQCGCGGKTRLSTTTNATRGLVRGEPMRYLKGHANRGSWRGPLGLEPYTVEPDTDCHVWNGCLSEDGYARMRRHGRQVYGHRWFWEQQNGPIAGDLIIDHLCRNRKCVNTEHMELVTNRENIQRGYRARYPELYAA